MCTETHLLKEGNFAENSRLFLDIHPYASVDTMRHIGRKAHWHVSSNTCCSAPCARVLWLAPAVDSRVSMRPGGRAGTGLQAKGRRPDRGPRAVPTRFDVFLSHATA